VTETYVDPPHPNGAVRQSGAAKSRRTRRHVLVALAILVVAAWAFAIVWSVTVTSSSPERLDGGAAVAVAGACNEARARMLALPNSFPRAGADRVTRIRAENDALRAMVASFRRVEPTEATPAAALTAWSDDWATLIDARAGYADDLQRVAGSDEKVSFSVPVARGVKPVTERMDDFVRENDPDLDACYSEALEAEQVEGVRDYDPVEP
jgi:hypothetical protein